MKKCFCLMVVIFILATTGYLFCQDESSAETGTKISLEQVVAAVNGDPITVGELLAEFSQLTAQQKENMTDADRETLLSGLIDRKLLLQKAIEMNLDTFGIIQQRVAQVKNNILADAVLNLVVQQQELDVTEEQLQQYYTDNESLFIIPTRVRISQIVVDTEDAASTIYNKLNKGERFAELAREFSIAAEANVGGDLGYFMEAQLSPDIAKIAFNMDIGKWSNIIAFRKNFLLIMVTDKIEPKKQAFDDVKDQLKQRVLQQLANQTMQTYQDALKRNSEITVNNPVLYSIPVK